MTADFKVHIVFSLFPLVSVFQGGDVGGLGGEIVTSSPHSGVQGTGNMRV